VPADAVSSDAVSSDAVAAAAAAPGSDRPAASELDTLSYEQARDGLIAVVAELEQGSPTLEQSLALWERGEALAQRCEQWLMGAKTRLDHARSGGDAAGTASRTAQQA
jgi:exodeoxyribonuclease VII small subunit